MAARARDKENAAAAWVAQQVPSLPHFEKALGAVRATLAGRRPLGDRPVNASSSPIRGMKGVCLAASLAAVQSPCGSRVESAGCGSGARAVGAEPVEEIEGCCGDSFESVASVSGSASVSDSAVVSGSGSAEDPVEAPVEATAESSLEASSSVETAVETATDTAVETAVETTVETTVEIAVKTAVETAVETATETAVETAVETTVEIAVETATETAVETAVEAAVETAVETAEIVETFEELEESFEEPAETMEDSEELAEPTTVEPTVEPTPVKTAEPTAVEPTPVNTGKTEPTPVKTGKTAEPTPADTPKHHREPHLASASQRIDSAVSALEGALASISDFDRRLAAGRPLAQLQQPQRHHCTPAKKPARADGLISPGTLERRLAEERAGWIRLFASKFRAERAIRARRIAASPTPLTPLPCSPGEEEEQDSFNSSFGSPDLRVAGRVTKPPTPPQRRNVDPASLAHWQHVHRMQNILG